MLFLKQLTKTKALIAILALISLSACSDKAPGPASEGQTRKPQVSVIDIEPTSQVMITTLQGRTLYGGRGKTPGRRNSSETPL